MDLERIIKMVWKWAWLVGLAACSAGGSSFLATRSAPRIYQTSTTIMIGRFIQDPDPNSGDFWVSEQLGLTYAQLARREPVLHGALASLNLADSIPWSILADNVNVILIPGTQLMEIVVNDTVPQRAKALADAIAQQLILQSPSNPSSDQEDRRAFAQEQLADLEVKIGDAEVEIQELQDELDDTISARRIQELQTQINAFQDRASSWQESYAQFLTFLQGGNVNYLTVVEQAPVPTFPIAPNVPINIALAVAIGATLAIGAALLLEWMDDTIKTSEDIEHLSPVPVLGTVGRIDDEKEESIPISIRLPNALIVEDYRVLRTNLQLSSGVFSKTSQEKQTQTLVVTSANRLEGKSTTASNLAIVIAQSGLSTILVDADMRRPTVHRKFDLPRVGLTEALLKTHPIRESQLGKSAVADFLQETTVENLRVLTSGHLPPNPADLLGSGYMGELIHALEAEADFVLFDTPPAGLVTDAVVLASQVDGVIVVVEYGRTRRSMFKRTLEALERTGTPILGVVFNRVAGRSNGYYGRQYLSDERERLTGRRMSAFVRFPLFKKPREVPKNTNNWIGPRT